MAGREINKARAVKTRSRLRMDDEVDKYDRSLEGLIGNQEKVGPDISEKVGRVLERCIDPILDDKAAKEKRDLFPRLGNVESLKVPRLNNLVYKKITQERQWVDRNLQQTQSFLLAGLTAVAYEAEHALKLRAWFNALKEEEKEELPPGLARLGKSYVTLMDATLLFTKTMGDITSLRRKLQRTTWLNRTSRCSMTKRIRLQQTGWPGTTSRLQ